MTKMIVGYRCAEQGVELTPQLIKKAEDRLKNDFAFIGLTEEWDVSICLFHQVSVMPHVFLYVETTQNAIFILYCVLLFKNVTHKDTCIKYIYIYM
jgi:hypothetical protein